MAIIIQSGWAIALALTGTFAQLVDTVVFADWIFFGLTAVAVFVFRRRLPLGQRPAGELAQTVESMMEDLKDSSGSKLKRTAEVWEGYTIPAEYLVMVEWESLPHAQGNMPHVNVKPELLFIHGPKVLNNCLHMPNVRMAESMFREQTYREVLNS